MKELDFDELDKAVNSLMANASVSGQKSEPSEKVLEVPTSAPLENTPPSIPKSPAVPVTAPARPSIQPSARSTSSSAPAARRGGRFMDVVHPSAAMKKDSPKPVSREATTIQPAKPADTSAVEEAKEAPKTSTEPTLANTPAEAPKSDWPDPLEMANFSGLDEKKDTPAPQDEPKLETPKPEQPKNNEESPLVSPFLPDTKVEKRPLGGNVSQNDTPALAPAMEDADDQLPATLEDTKPLLPEELHSDLVAIESDTTSPEKHEEEKVPDWKPPVTDAPEGEKKSSLPLAKEKEKPVISSGPVSIPQQYKEEKSTGDQENGAIYDTNAYHQPLSHPAKQKSGWMWVVWIVLILVVGAGGGAALYFAGIIR